MANKPWDIIHSKYIASAVRPEQYPQPELTEVAFIGRSNVGKSSLINSLCRRNGLARVSSTPGKTQTSSVSARYAAAWYTLWEASRNAIKALVRLSIYASTS